MTQVSAEHDLYTLGAILSRTTASPLRVERAIDGLGIVPRLRVNGVVHFDAAQVERILERLSAVSSNVQRLSR